MFSKIPQLPLILLLPALAAAEQSSPLPGTQEQQPTILQLKRDMVIIHSIAEFNNHLEHIALNGRTTTNCLFTGKLKGKEKETLQRSLWHNYAESVTISYHADTSVVFAFNYKDHVRLLAAHLNPDLLPTLTPAERQALATARQRVQQLTTPQMTAQQKVRALHDDLVNRATYDLEAGGSCTTMLLSGRGVCEAYSRTLWLLNRMAGVPTLIAAGQTDEPHAWNLVQIDGEWYHVDATWDDPTILGSDKSILSHSYFLLNDDQIAADHSWDRSTLPVSARKDSLYFRTNNAYFTNYGQFWQGVAAAIDSGATEYEAYLTAYGDKNAFENSLHQNLHHLPALQAIRTWSGPTGKAGVVRLTFNYSGTPPRATEEVLQVTRAAVERAQKWVKDGGLTNWTKDIDLSPIVQEIEHACDEAKRQIGEAASQAADAVEQKATEWYNSAADEIKSWF